MINVKVEHNKCKAGEPTSLGLMLEVTAPQAPVVENTTPRQRAIIFVVDRSGSMAGTPLEMVKQTIIETLPRMNGDDYIGVVVFDDEARVQVPLMRLKTYDLKQLTDRIASIQDGGSTNLEAGYMLALEQAKGLTAQIDTNIVLLSDGHANAGIVDPAELGRRAAFATEHLVATSTIGIGRGYDEQILDALATQGNGNHIAAIEYAEVLNGLQAQIDDLLAKTMTDLTVEVMVGPAFCGNNVRVHAGRRMKKWQLIANGYVKGLVGDLSSGEEKNIVFDVVLDAHPMTQPGVHTGIKIHYYWTDPFTSEKHGEVRDFNVELVAADQWVEPERDEDIVAELKIVRLAKIQQRAMDLYMQGREKEADALLEQAGIDLREFMQNAKLTMRSNMRMQRMQNEMMMFSTLDDANIKRKRLHESTNRLARDKRDFRDEDQI